MKKDLHQMSIAELQSIFMTDTRRFIEALDDGTPVELLHPMRARIKEIGQLIDLKRMKEEGTSRKYYSQSSGSWQ